MDTNNEIWNKVACYLDGEMDIEERLNFEQQIKTDPNLKELLNNCTNDQEMVNNFSIDKPHFNADIAWKKIVKKIDHPIQKNHLIKSIRLSASRIIRIAAILAIMIGSGWFLVTQLNPKTNTAITEVSTSASETQIVHLMDGSIVYLNINSTIQFPKKFAQDLRQITLKGEAFFEIERNEKKPFIINTSNAEVTVLGTTFNVHSTGNEYTEVTVASGKVSLKGINKADTIVLTQGSCGQLYRTELKKHLNTNQNYLAWKDKKLTFRKTLLSDALFEIEKAYHIKINIDKVQIDHMTLTAYYDSLSTLQLLETVANTFNLSLEFKNETYYLFQ